MKVIRKRDVSVGDVVSFVYNGTDRVGEVDRVFNGNITIAHDVPDRHSGKQFSTYKLSRIEGRLKVLSVAKSR